MAAVLCNGISKLCSGKIHQVRVDSLLALSGMVYVIVESHTHHTLSSLLPSNMRGRRGDTLFALQGLRTRMRLDIGLMPLALLYLHIIYTRSQHSR